MVFAVPADHRVKLKENTNKDKYLDLAKELKKTVEHTSDNYTSCDWCSWYSYERVLKGIVGLENNGTSVDHPHDHILENDQNTEKNPGDLRILAVIQS